MANINQKVWQILDSDLSVKKDLARKIVNTRALARDIIKRYNLKTSLDAVISAIRRFEAQGNFVKEDKQMRNLLKNSLIRTRTNLTCFTIKIKPREFFKKVQDVDMNIPGTRVSSGSFAVKLVVISDKADRIRKKFKDHIIKEEKELGEIKLELSDEACQTKGVLARIASEISLHDINIQEFFICPPEFLIYVREKDLVKTHQSIVELTRL